MYFVWNLYEFCMYVWWVLYSIIQPVLEKIALLERNQYRHTYIHTYRQTDRQTDRFKDTRTEKATEGTERQTDR